MIKKLMIVESPSKVDKLKLILKDIEPETHWIIRASGGHIEALNSDNDGRFGSLGINKKTLETDYVLTGGGSGKVQKLLNDIKNNEFEQIILAADPDREGEAIAESLRIRLKLSDDDYDRCTFQEITKSGVKKALEESRKIDRNLLKAQSTRRILDRVVGWEAGSAVSNVLKQKTPIGRVLSQAVYFVVMRERERRAFEEQSYYEISADMGEWKAKLDLVKSGIVKPKELWLDKAAAKKLSDSLKDKRLTVVDSTKEKKEAYAPPPFDTSTLNTVATKKLNWNLAKVAKIAQELYQKSHITYIRTDSTVLSSEAFELLVAYANKNGYNTVDVVREGRKGKVEQEAHECIRPTDFEFDGDGLTADEKKLYKLIKDRCVASQLVAAIYDSVSLVLKSEQDHIFKATGSVLIDKGWKAWFEDDESNTKASARNNVPYFEVGETLNIKTGKLSSKKTKIAKRYGESELYDALTKHGIGRPATTSKIIAKMYPDAHGYVTLEKGTLIPTEHAERMVEVTENELCVMDTEFTASLEDYLDDLANDHVANKDEYLFAFFNKLTDNLENLTKKYAPKPIECLICQKVTLNKFIQNGKTAFWYCADESCNGVFSDEDGKPILPRECIACEQPTLSRFLKKNGEDYFWRCSSENCNKSFSDDNGEPVKPSECLSCHQETLNRFQYSSGTGHFWRCGDNNCGVFFNDYNGKPIQTVECFTCGENTLGCFSYKSGDGHYWRCKNKECGVFFNDAAGKPVKPIECLACHKVTLNRSSYKNREGYYWRCQDADCGKFFDDDDGSPIDANAKFYNEDGSPKHPCPTCEQAMICIHKKDGGAFWTCSDKECKTSMDNTKFDTPDIEKWQNRMDYLEKVKSAYDDTGKPLIPCPDCKDAMIELTSRSGSPYKKCVNKECKKAVYDT